MGAPWPGGIGTLASGGGPLTSGERHPDPTRPPSPATWTAFTSHQDHPHQPPRPPSPATKTPLTSHQDPPHQPPGPPSPATKTTLTSHQDRCHQPPRPPSPATRTAVTSHQDRPHQPPRPLSPATKTVLTSHLDPPVRAWGLASPAAGDRFLPGPLPHPRMRATPFAARSLVRGRGRQVAHDVAAVVVIEEMRREKRGVGDQRRDDGAPITTATRYEYCAA